VHTLDLKEITEFIQGQVNDFFAPNTANIIGIDIGMSAIKFADVSKLSDGNYKINNFVYKELPDGTVIEDEIQKEDELLQALQEGLKELNASTKFVSIGLSGPNTFMKRLQLPGGASEEVEDQVTWEAEQYLPFPFRNHFHELGLKSFELHQHRLNQFLGQVL
jgi:type IV pilus assembly protein PilM